MQRNQRGFTLIELIAVVILISIISATAMSRFSTLYVTKVQAGRDDLIAACFFAQQTAMARSSSTNVVRLVVSASSISVTENNSPISIGELKYPMNFSSGVSVAPATTFVFDKLGRTTAAAITLSASGASVTVNVESSGYAH